MISIGLFGFGRIGRALTRQILDAKNLEIKFICDANPSIENIEYLLKYDSTYGKLKYNILLNSNKLSVANHTINFYNKTQFNSIDFEGIDFVIDATGSQKLNESLREKLKHKSLKLIQTNSPKCNTKKIIMGVNQDELNSNDNVICSSICDATACATLLASIGKLEEIEFGSITTLHPWLGYQNILDGPSSMFSVENSIYENFGLGRSSNDNLIPKLTSCVSAVEDIMPKVTGKIEGMSVRVPTKIVSAATVYLKYNNDISIDYIHNCILNSSQLENGYIELSSDHRVSTDFIGTTKNAYIDKRWTHVNDNNLLRMYIWYDNEWGYSANVIRLIEYWNKILIN